MRGRVSTLFVAMTLVIMVVSSTNLLSQDLIFTDDFEWGSICAWSNLWYPDVDDDSWGDESAAGFGVSCPPPDFSAVNNIDCMDSDPMVNPGALEIASGGVDDDCDGEIDEIDTRCSEPYSIFDVDPINAARTIELCQTTSMGNPKWGVLSAEYVRANGDSLASASAAFGLLPFFWVVFPLVGERFLGLSSGHARDEGQPGPCGSPSCDTLGPGVPPPGFPQDVPGCAGGSEIHDDIGFEVTLRAPTNANGFSFQFAFYAFGWANYVCTVYDDQFVVLMDPPPPAAINGNIAFDSQGRPVSVNSSLIEVCYSGFVGNYASQCSVNCPPPPNPYCPLGHDRLVGTGFDTWDPADPGGATSWVEVTAPVVPGEDFSLRFAIWDTGDSYYDSTVLIDAFEWILIP